MKCTFCNGTLSLEDKYCPFCGKPNEAAKQHIQDMAHYKGEFEKTQKYVKEKTVFFSQIAVRVVMIAVLIILIIVTFLVGSSSYSIVRDIRRNQAEEQHEEYTAVLDRCLKERDYEAYFKFCETHCIAYNGSVYYEKYQGLQRLIANYFYGIQWLQKYAISPDEFRDTEMRLAMENLNDFYDVYNARNERESWETGDNTLLLQVYEDMEKELRDYLVVYCNFTREEADGLSELTDAKRALLFEEKWGG